MTVSRILNQKGWDVFTVQSTSPLQQVIDTLAANKVGVVVVTDAKGSLAGIVSERDVMRVLSGNATGALGKTAADVMTASVETCTPDDAESHIMERMNARGVRHLPVLAGGKLTGIVSLRDVIKLRIEKIEELMRTVTREAALQK
jgi:CBS domain-containing protein